MLDRAEQSGATVPMWARPLLFTHPSNLGDLVKSTKSLPTTYSSPSFICTPSSAAAYHNQSASEVNTS